jgi:7,8-dihydroneopterin 2',3'-cyclic phosphate phosphodiesterase
MLNPILKTLVNKIRDRKLRKRVEEFLANPTFEVNGKTYSGLSLDVSPAGLSHHHCYPGGYIEHVVSTSNLAMALCDSVEKVYNGKVNRDLVAAGVLLHDIFKPITYAINKNGSYSSTSIADCLDHSSLAISELVRRGFPLELVHIVGAHHGDYGPVKPRTIEALICHLADLVDSRLNGEVLGAAAFLARKVTGEDLPRLTAQEALEVINAKAAHGVDGVAKAVENIKQKRETHKT